MTTVIISTQGWSGWPEFAGSTWVPMQYLLGFERLGVDCYWVDHLGHLDPLEHPHSLEYLARRFDWTAREFGFQDRYCLVYEGGKSQFGLPAGKLAEVAREAELLLALSGAKRLPPDSPLLRIPRRAYFDLDPGFTQLWAAGNCDLGFDQYQLFFTVGLNVGGPGFEIPTGVIEWRPIFPPVVLDQWPERVDEKCRRFSTVADWWGSQHSRFRGELYSGKREEFLRFIEVPVKAKRVFEVALSIYQKDSSDLALLHQNGWRIKNPAIVAGDPHSYREFIQNSRAEFSVAKGGYVKSRGGWFSDRSACYLASGKPVLVQSTGLEEHLPTGKGLLTFRTVEEALAGLEAINGDYLAHCEAARALARKYLDSDLVLRSILDICQSGCCV
jgi:hypothetical protein